MAIVVGSVVAGLLACSLLSIGGSLVVGGLAGALNDAAEADSPPEKAPAVSPVDDAELSTYWSDNFAQTSWYELTGVPAWDGTALVAETKLFADGDAVEPALAICAAMSNYWAMAGQEFRPVRVLDQQGGVLVSRHTVDDRCTWRR